MSPYQNDLRNVTLPTLAPLRNSNILITGATGLVGSTLVDLLLLYADRYDYTIYAGCRTKDKFENRFGAESHRLVFFEIDVTRPIHVSKTFDYIVHAASGASPLDFQKDPVGVMKANLLGTVNLLDYGVENRTRRFLYLSSGEVYGKGCSDRWTETDSGYVDSMSPRSCYPSSKRAAETLCTSYTKEYGIETVVARLCHTYGPYFTEKDNRVYAQFIRNVLHGEDIVLKSAGEQFRSWLYVVDCAAALLYILTKGKSGEAYNVADDNSNVTIRQLAEIIAEMTGKRVVLDFTPTQGIQKNELIVRAVFDTVKIESLGWASSYSLKQGIRNTIDSRLL